ncbi:hypothetical protein [Treponema sp.]|uniref:hypothetical protein n=1 Tax=Treponema sp. TaxID=166 RepID=UPI003F0A0818
MAKSIKTRKQVLKSEQILANKSLILDYDQPLVSSKDILQTLKNALGSEVEIIKYQNTKNIYAYKHGNRTDFLLCGAVTYLSNPHPVFKKRFQLKKWFKDFYAEYSCKHNVSIKLVGIYHYEGLVLFVNFRTEDYIGRKLNSSAAHVYTNDLYQGLSNGYFKKIDQKENHIEVLTSRTFKSFLDGKNIDNPIYSLFNKFNSKFDFGKWIYANDAISEMKENDWYQWKGAEWPGWFLEYKFSCFIIAENCQGEMIYIGNIKDKNQKLLDFDLFFPHANYYGDLKASDIDKNEAPGNDQENVLQAINKYEKLWYVIYEHKTEKDSFHGNEMAIKRMNLLGKTYKSGDEISYAKKMKHSVEFLQMKIFELNRINLNETLSVFNQGHQPSGEKRKPKFLINKKNIENFIVYSYKYKKKVEYKMQQDYGIKKIASPKSNYKV